MKSLLKSYEFRSVEKDIMANFVFLIYQTNQEKIVEIWKDKLLNGVVLCKILKKME
jgi:hypothetical protein